ncbi:DnaB-like helicase C-terminal domain-containing protein [Sporosarcina pasteurii]|uniref:DNA 5'-3' helicase n=1 Tax=Sporosarcina pasteurii TaxID=1474 RepID=A0A380C0Q5_SPOPA|nr:DnaB-like helicase C-terminal domain-containing protein [Sporosarcina pasteurii]MDS9471519.1 DnaB-like helicase C-terminal domain-containing protein [Sporosarcina pasteurii]SUJ10637.1 Replicative DNA helicase [Sporosarcina pasteurii]
MIAEKAVLGAMLKENYLITESNLNVMQFTDPVNKMIFQSMIELRKAGKTVDMITLLTSYSPQDLGGANYLNDLTNYAHLERFDNHVGELLDVWREREKKNVLHVSAHEDWSIDKITAELTALTDNRVNDHSDILSMLVDVYEDAFIEKDIKEGAPSGIDKLDDMTNGFQDGELTILAARPSMGKSDVMLHIAKQSGWKGYLPIIFSLEMSDSSLRDRLIASTGRYSRSRMRNPYSMLTDRQKEIWPQAIGLLSETKIQIFDRSRQTVPEMRMKIRKMMSEHQGMKPLILIDYLTLIHSDENKQNMHLQVSSITKELKAVAREFDCPVITLAQLSRAVEQRQDKRPIMADLRESGSIEEDADVIVFLYRDAYYTKDEDDNLMEMIVAKNRNGPVGTAVAQYNKYTGEVLNGEPISERVVV